MLLTSFLENIDLFLWINILPFISYFFDLIRIILDIIDVIEYDEQG